MHTKAVIATRSAPDRHWVGDGFHVHGMFGYDSGAQARSPFLMLDYAAPTQFAPTTTRRGVGTHPHRGFETVTIVYAGEVEHRDSTGQGGVIGPGDVQWMTAGAGILHEEFHSERYARTGGRFEMAQLWVNLPAKDKMSPPGYQAVMASDMGVADLLGGDARKAGHVRVIAGHFVDGTQSVRGPARTFTPMNVWDVCVRQGNSVRLPLPEGWPAQVVARKGAMVVNGTSNLIATQMLSTSGQGSCIEVTATTDCELLLLAGEPIAEPIVGYGPFVMNSREEIVQAIDDFNAGKFGPMDARQ